MIFNDIIYVLRLSPKHHNIYKERHCRRGPCLQLRGRQKAVPDQLLRYPHLVLFSLQEWKCGLKHNLRPKKVKIEYIIIIIIIINIYLFIFIYIYLYNRSIYPPKLHWFSMILPGSPGIVCSTCSTGSPFASSGSKGGGMVSRIAWGSQRGSGWLTPDIPMAYDGVFLALWPMPLQSAEIEINLPILQFYETVTM